MHTVHIMHNAYRQALPYVKILQNPRLYCVFLNIAVQISKLLQFADTVCDSQIVHSESFV